MTNTTQLTSQLTKLHKFNTDSLSKFSEFQKFTFDAKTREFYLLNKLIRTSTGEKESLKSLMKENSTDFTKAYKKSIVLLIIGNLLLWFFDVSEMLRGGFLIVASLYCIFIYFNKKIIEVQNNLHLVSKMESLKFYEYLADNLINKGYLECEFEWRKLIEKRGSDFYQTEVIEETEEEKLIELIFEAAVKRAIIEDITGEKSYSYMLS